jgi:hypothetical protein
VSARVERHVERLADRVMLTLLSTLVRLYNLRLVPESVLRLRQVIEEALREAAVAGKLDTLHPPTPLGPDQSMIDTKPYKTRPPPPKK